MASLCKPPPTYFHRHHHTNPISLCSSPLILSFSFNRTVSLQPRLCVLRFGADGSDLLRKPIIPPGKDLGGISEEDEDSDGNKNYKEKDEEEAWVDWEDQILEDTVPLVGFVRMILHSDKYESGQKLTPEHEKTIRERLLPYHPECEKKIGCGIDYITITQKRCTMASCISSLKDHAKAGAHELGTRVGYHPDFEASRCLFIVRKDGELVDFSYWKCIKGLIRKNYPLYADSFILRHFRQRRRNG